MGRALIVQGVVRRTFWKRAVNLDRLPSAWPALRLFEPTASPQMLLDALHKLLPRAKLALLLRHPEGEMYYVEATCGYPSDDLSWVQFTQDSPLIRHLVAHPVTTRRDQLERLPWFQFLPDPDREAMAALGPIVFEPISNERGLTGLLVLGRRNTGRSGNLERVHPQRTWAGLSDADRARLAAIFEVWEPIQQHRTVQPRPGLALPLPGEMNRAIYSGDIPEQTARGVAHDLNNILTIIISHAQLLEEEQKEADIRRHAAAIRQAGQDGAESVLRMRRMPDRPPDLEFHRLEVNELIRTTLYILEPHWRQGRISYLSNVPFRGPLQTAIGATPAHPGHTDPAPELQVTLLPGGYILGSPTELRRVLTNILTNAVESLPQQNGRIDITSGRDRCHAVIKVSDNGAGIFHELRGRIFEPYFTTKARRGRGLGLSICQSIVSSHGGILEVESKEGCGSTFTILLPQAESEAGHQEEPAHPTGP